MTWKSFHRRGEVLRDVIVRADTRQDGRLPMDVAGVAETFGNELTLLGALTLRWHTRLAGRIERELLAQPMDLEASVIAAWQATADDLPGVLAILDHHRADPLDGAMATAMSRSTAKEHTLLAVMAGQAATGDALAPRAGERIAARARAARGRVSDLASTPISLVDRLKAMLTVA